MTMITQPVFFVWLKSLILSRGVWVMVSFTSMCWWIKEAEGGQEDGEQAEQSSKDVS